MKKSVTTLLLAASVPVFASTSVDHYLPLDISEVSQVRALPRAIECAVSNSTTGEWRGHTSLDGLHPDGGEQQMIWLMNRARQNPSAEGSWLANSSEPSIADARDHFEVDTIQLQKEFSELPTVQPAATVCAFEPDILGINSYTLDDDEGNPYILTILAHAGFNIDYGDDLYGMKPDRPHRANIMSNESSSTWFDITSPIPSKLSITGNYDYKNTQQFIVGTVWEDENSNDRYDEGEGVSGATITIEPPGTDGTNSYDHVITSKGGGYSIPVIAETYTATFTSEDPKIPAGVFDPLQVVVNEGNALADYQLIRCDVLEDGPYTVIPDTYGPDPYVICSKTKITAGSDVGETTVVENGVLRFNSPSIAIQHKFNVNNTGVFSTSNIRGMYQATPPL